MYFNLINVFHVFDPESLAVCVFFFHSDMRLSRDPVLIEQEKETAGRDGDKD